ncbi:MAG: MFS transporter [Candidatus Marinarcus sp.]|uniref:MFS transporter n=1 Tax=Candidatus Marinarcus sp. TaxID=3100987 RepID=UPI003B000B76
MRSYSKILLCSVLILFSSLGLGRFAFGMILPNMQESLLLTTTQIGFIGTANFIGYFIGILFTSNLYNRFETYKLIPTALFFQGGSILAISFSNSYISASVFYTISGFFAAISTISIMVYISHIIPENQKGKALGIVTMGNGFGIIVSGLLVPLIHAIYIETSWRISWALFALTIVIISVYVQNSLKIHDTQQKHSYNKNIKEIIKTFKFWKVAILYLIFGITYVVYVTFFVTASIEKFQVSTYQSGLFWTILGLTSLASGPVFGTLSDKMGGYKSLILIYLLQTVSMLILVFHLPMYTLYFSAFIFGLSAWAIPSIIALLSSQEFDKTRTAQVFSLVTLIFAVGQAIAPVGAGFIHDIYDNFTLVFAGCAFLTLFGTLFAFLVQTKTENKG